MFYVSFLYLFFLNIFATFHVNSVTVVPRIVGGTETMHPIPYQVSIQRRKSQEWNHFCGGSIITSSHVLTAAHCVYKKDSKRISILAGTTKRSANSTRYLVQSFAIHPEFQLNNHHDIAIVKTRTRIVFNAMAAPIKFERKNYISAGTDCRVSGWGTMDRIRSGPFPEELQTANLKTLSNEYCRSYYDITRNEICASGISDEGTCTGDSGGPLVDVSRSNLIGIASYGTTYCGTGIPDVYTRVSVFVSWIQSVIWSE